MMKNRMSPQSYDLNCPKESVSIEVVHVMLFHNIVCNVVLACKYTYSFNFSTLGGCLYSSCGECLQGILGVVGIAETDMSLTPLVLCVAL